MIRFCEKEKQKQRKLKRVFSKKQMKLILAVEYAVNGNIIRTSAQIEMKQMIMTENVQKFFLIYSSPIFYKNILSKIGNYRQNQTA